MLSLVGRWLLAKWMTQNDLECLLHVKIRFRPALERLIFKNNAWKVTNIDSSYQQQKCMSMTLVSGNINNIYTYSKAFQRLLVLSSNQSGVVKIDEYPADALSSPVSEILSTLLYIMTTIRSVFLLTPIRMTLNDLECPIHLEVRLAVSTLDVRTLWHSVWFRADQCLWLNEHGPQLSMTKIWPMNCSFWARGLYEFSRGLLHRRRRTGMELLKLVTFHLMHFADIVRCVAFCTIIINGFLVTQR